MRVKLSRLFPAHGVQYELHPAGNFQLLEYAIQVITDRMLGDAKSLRNFAVLHSLRNQPGYFLLAWGEQVHPVLLRQTRAELRKRLKQKLDLSIVGPNLAVVNTANTFSQ